MQHEILAPRPLLDESGAVAEPGFARRPLLRYDPERIGLTPLRCLNRLRLKEWDFYAAITREMSFAAGIAHGGIAGVVFAQLIDFRARTMRERAAVTPLGCCCALPRSSDAGDAVFRRGGLEVALLRRGAGRQVRVRWPQFDGERPLEADLEIDEPSESLFIATPIGARGFYYNRKACGMPVRGAIAAGAARYDLAASGALATLDWGRGVWPYHTFWLWATGSGRVPDGRTLGINLGTGFGDDSAATENCVLVDGRMTKLGRVEFDYDRADPTARPWRFRAPDGRLDLELDASLFAFRKRRSALVIASDLRQITGVWRGRVTTEAGERLEVDGALGWAEEHRARW